MKVKYFYVVVEGPNSYKKAIVVCYLSDSDGELAVKVVVLDFEYSNENYINDRILEILHSKRLVEDSNIVNLLDEPDNSSYQSYCKVINDGVSELVGTSQYKFVSDEFNKEIISKVFDILGVDKVDR